MGLIYHRPSGEKFQRSPKLMFRRHLYVFYKTVVQSMFKHVASENVPLVLILQSYLQIFIVLRHID